MNENVFRVILLVLLLIFMAHRGYHVQKHSKPERETVKERKEGIASKVAGLLGLVGFISLIVVVINPDWLSWTNLSLPLWLRWVGIVIYTAFILILSSTLLISVNWLVGLAWIGMTTLEIISRIHFEESLMLEYFGDQYHEYIDCTNRLLPKIH